MCQLESWVVVDKNKATLVTIWGRSGQYIYRAPRDVSSFSSKMNHIVKEIGQRRGSCATRTNKTMAT